MVADCVVAQPERLCNFPVRLPFRHQSEHLPFGRGNGDWAKGLLKLLAGKQRAPAQHVLNRLGDLLTRKVVWHAGVDVVSRHVQVEIPISGLRRNQHALDTRPAARLAIPEPAEEVEQWPIVQMWPTDDQSIISSRQHLELLDAVNDSVDTRCGREADVIENGRNAAAKSGASIQNDDLRGAMAVPNAIHAFYFRCSLLGELQSQSFKGPQAERQLRTGNAGALAPARADISTTESWDAAIYL